MLAYGPDDAEQRRVLYWEEADEDMLVPGGVVGFLERAIRATGRQELFVTADTMQIMDTNADYRDK